MEVVVVGAFFNTFLPKVWEVIHGQHPRRYHIQTYIDSIQSDLPILAASIRDHELKCGGRPGSDASQKIIEKARRLAQRVDDRICRFLLHKTTSHIDKMSTQEKFEFDIKHLMEEVVTLKGEVNNLQSSSTPIEEPQDLHYGNYEFVGMGVPIKELVDLLGCVMPKQGEPTTKIGTGKLKVISIVGSGGSGKTCLARQVLEKAGKHFRGHPLPLVSMADRNMDVVLDDIREKVRAITSTCVQHADNGAGTPDGVQQADNSAGASAGAKQADEGAGASAVQKVAGAAGVQQVDNAAGTTCIQQIAKCAGTSTGVDHVVDNGAEQRYLLAIDDVRTTGRWDTLMKALPADSDVGNRIIVTTTSQVVAEHCSYPSGHVYKMSTLSYEDSQKLFWNACKKDLSGVEKKDLSTLLEKCDRLPLATIELAEYFKVRQVEQFACQEAMRKLLTPEGTLTRMQWVLMKNYSDLACYRAKACLLYFHMFPYENSQKRKFLTRRWLAEGLVQRVDSEGTDLHAASRYLRTFRDGNIIRSMEVSNGDVKSCRLTGTMYEFISHQSMSQDFVRFLTKVDDPDEAKTPFVRRLSLHDGAAANPKGIKDVDVSLLRTLAVSGKACKPVLDFSKYELLLVLDLKKWDYHGEKLQKKLRYICKLVMLKYLGLPESIGQVPKVIKDLINLETLDLDVERAEIVELCKEVINHPTLKHLLGKFRLCASESYKKCDPKQSQLETFSGFVTNEKAVLPKLMKDMEQLRKVKMWCECDSKAKEKEVMEHLPIAIKEFIDKKYCHLKRSLSIDVKDCSAPFIKTLNFAGNLNKLKLHGTLEELPKFITPQLVVTPDPSEVSEQIVATPTTRWKKFITRQVVVTPAPIAVSAQMIATPTTKKKKFITPLDDLRKLCLSLTTLCGESCQFPFKLQPDAEFLPDLTYLKLVEDKLGPLQIWKSHFPNLVRICLVANIEINPITIEAGALEHLFSLHVICERLEGLAGIEIGGLKKLKEITLHSKVSQTTKDAWKDAARDHPNKPQVLFLEAAPKPCSLKHKQVLPS